MWKNCCLGIRTDNYVTKGGSEQRSKRLKARRVIPSMLATTESKKEDTTPRTAKICSLSASCPHSNLLHG